MSSSSSFHSASPSALYLTRRHLALPPRCRPPAAFWRSSSVHGRQCSSCAHARPPALLLMCARAAADAPPRWTRDRRPRSSRRRLLLRQGHGRLLLGAPHPSMLAPRSERRCALATTAAAASPRLPPMLRPCPFISARVTSAEWLDPVRSFWWNGANRI